MTVATWDSPSTLWDDPVITWDGFGGTPSSTPTTGVKLTVEHDNRITFRSNQRVTFGGTDEDA